MAIHLVCTQTVPAFEVMRSRPEMSAAPTSLPAFPVWGPVIVTVWAEAENPLVPASKAKKLTESASLINDGS